MHLNLIDKIACGRSVIERNGPAENATDGKQFISVVKLCDPDANKKFLFSLSRIIKLSRYEKLPN